MIEDIYLPGMIERISTYVLLIIRENHSRIVERIQHTHTKAEYKASTLLYYICLDATRAHRAAPIITLSRSCTASSSQRIPPPTAISIYKYYFIDLRVFDPINDGWLAHTSHITTTSMLGGKDGRCGATKQLGLVFHNFGLFAQ